MTSSLRAIASLRATVSLIALAAALPATLGLAACSSVRAPATWDGTPAAADGPVEVRFVNEAQSYVDVYLVSQVREWRLGRVSAGAVTTLRIPAEELAGVAGPVRLAVLAGAPYTTQAATNPRATLTVGQSAAALLAQRWSYRPHMGTAGELVGAAVSVSP